MIAAPGEVCGVCAAPLRAAARFCGGCGAAHGAMVPRELGVGGDDDVVARASSRRPLLTGRRLAIALVAYGAVLVFAVRVWFS
jgi:hypothetical protein